MKKILLLLLFCGFLSGCYVQSLNKFYTDDLTVKFPQVIGEWHSAIQMGDDVSVKKISPWKFTEDTMETYDEDNKYSELEVVYFKIGTNMFMDVTAGEPMKDSEDFGNGFWSVGITLVHSLCKIAVKEDTLVFVPMNMDWVEKKIENKKLKLSFVKADKDSNYIFTASSKEWASFLEKHADDKDMFNDEYKFVFKKSKIKRE